MRSTERSRVELGVVVAALIVALVLPSCGPGSGDAAVGADTVKQLEDVLRARARAVAQRDRDAFLRTIDITKPAFRRTQLAFFDLPALFGGLNSTFTLSGVERHGDSLRGFVEERHDGVAFPPPLQSVSYSRRYFRNDSGKWLLTEPTGDQTGPERRRSGDGVELTYWTLDEDVAPVFVRELEEARRFALSRSPRPVEFKLEVAVVPTAELAGPGWDGWPRTGGAGPGSRQLLYPLSYSFDRTRTGVSTATQVNLRAIALDHVRDRIAPGVGPRLFLNQWLDHGWFDHALGLDFSATLKQSCAAPIPSLKQLSEGLPRFGEGDVAPESYLRQYALAQSMVAYLIERYGNDAFWRLTAEFVPNSSAAANFQKITQTTPDDFYAAWQVWLKKKHCA